MTIPSLTASGSDLIAPLTRLFRLLLLPPRERLRRHPLVLVEGIRSGRDPALAGRVLEGPQRVVDALRLGAVAQRRREVVGQEALGLRGADGRDRLEHLRVVPRLGQWP